MLYGGDGDDIYTISELDCDEDSADLIESDNSGIDTVDASLAWTKLTPN